MKAMKATTTMKAKKEQKVMKAMKAMKAMKEIKMTQGAKKAMKNVGKGKASKKLTMESKVQDALGKLGNVLKKTLDAKKSIDVKGPRITKLVYHNNKYKNIKAEKIMKSVKAIYTRTSSKTNEKKVASSMRVKDRRQWHV